MESGRKGREAISWWTVPMGGKSKRNITWVEILPGEWAVGTTHWAPLPFLPDSTWLFLSSTLQLVFSESGSTCRCIFDMFIVGGELHLLLYLLDLLPLKSLISYIPWTKVELWAKVKDFPKATKDPYRSEEGFNIAIQTHQPGFSNMSASSYAWW